MYVSVYKWFSIDLKLSCPRDALSDLAVHFLNKMKIMVVKDIEREDIEFICKVSAVVQLCLQCLCTKTCLIGFDNFKCNFNLYFTLP